MKQNEYTAQFAVYAVLASQIVISADLRTLKSTHPECLALLLNKELLAVSQDAAANAPRVVFGGNATAKPTAQCFSRKMANGDVVVALLNRAESSQKLFVGWAQLGLPPTSRCNVRDMIRGKDIVHSVGEVSVTLGGHEAAAVRISCFKDDP